MSFAVSESNADENELEIRQLSNAGRYSAALLATV